MEQEILIKKQNIAIVLGSKGVNATGLIRSLGQAGIDVTFASHYSQIESKHTKHYLQLPENSERWIGALTAYINEQKDKCVIFPCDDEAAFFLDDHYEDLKGKCFFSHANGHLRELADKTIMAQLAKKAGLAVPDFFKLTLGEKSVSVPELPVIVKPYAGYAGSKGDICICKSGESYCDSLDELARQGYSQVMVQKLLDAPGMEEIGLMGMVLPNGQMVIPGVIHKIRSYPTGRGSTSYARFSPDISALDLEALKRFVKSTGYVGLFDIEMIFSEEKARFIEINYRNGQYGYTPTAAGYNLPENWYMGMVENSESQPQNLKEIYYINEREDFLHVKHGEVTLSQWLKEFRGASAHGMYCKGDQRPYIRQYLKVPDRVSIFLKHIRDLLIKEEWNIAVRPVGGKRVWQENGCYVPFRVLPNSIRYWAADPFVISHKGKDYLFFEMFDRFKSKGLIGCREIENGKFGKMHVVYEAEHHLSFPFVFEKNGVFYMMPEYSEGKCLKLLKAEHFPDKWVEECEWMEGKRIVDSALLDYEGSCYLFTQEFQRGYSSDTLDIYILKEDDWYPHPANPVVTSSANSRLAGKVFSYENELFRVAQDCSEEYGKQICFNRIDLLNEQEYHEQIVKKISVQDILLKQFRWQFTGLHTYNADSHFEVIDLKNPDRIRIGNILNIIYRFFAKLRKK